MEDYKDRTLDIEVRKASYLAKVIKTFNSENRATEDQRNNCGAEWTSCVYYPTETSNGCAIGMDLSSSLHAKIKAEQYNASASTLVIDFREDIPRWMDDFDGEFLNALQRLHDGKHYWDKSGLSTSGKRWIKQNEYLTPYYNHPNYPLK